LIWRAVDFYRNQVLKPEKFDELKAKDDKSK
jgi:hypothetical protein